MASQTTNQTSALYPDFETIVEQARTAGDQFITTSRKLAGAYLDGVEKYVGGVAQFQRKLGEEVKLEPLTGLLNAQAKLAVDLTSTSVAAARELITA